MSGNSNSVEAAHVGFPVGAFITVAAKLNEVVRCLRKAKLLKTGKNVTPFEPGSVSQSTEAQQEESNQKEPRFAVHCCGVVNDDILGTLIPQAAEAYVPWLRVRSAACSPLQPLIALGDVIPASPPERSRNLDTCCGPTSLRPLRMIELFAGIGMFRLAAEMTHRIQCVFASEISQPARYIYEKNFHETPSGDITELPSELIPAHDILTAGFPCQSFSAAGDEGGFDDPRGMLFFEVCRILRGKKPVAFLLENVANLTTMEDGRVLEDVLASLEACGYTVIHKIIDAAHVVPQRRRRVYLVGFVTEVWVAAKVSFAWPFQTEENLSGTHDASATERGLSRKRVRDILEDCGAEAVGDLCLTESQRMSVSRRGSHAVLDLDGHAKTVMGSYRRSFQKFSQFVPLETLGLPTTTTPSASHDAAAVSAVTGEGLPVPLVPLRFLSVRECARLQGIPDTFDLSFTSDRRHGVTAPAGDHAAYKLVGNAVCPLVVRSLFDAILHFLDANSASV